MNPLSIFKTVGISVGLGSGITGSIFSSFHAFTKIKIEDFLKNDWFDYTDNSDWKLLKEKLNSSNSDEKKMELAKLREVKDSKNDTNGAKLKTWCENKKSFKIKKLLPSSFESILLSYIKNFCILTIGEKLTSANQFTSLDTDKQKLTENTKKLDSHSSGTNWDLSKEPKLNEIKDITSNTNNEKEKSLLNWCQKTYKKSYKGENDNLWKLADHYCKKTQ